MPLLIEEDSLVDNFGHGRWNGARGQRVSVRKLPGYDAPVSIYVHPDRIQFPAPGVFGGEPSATNLLLKNGVNLAVNGSLPTGEIILNAPGDTFTSVVAGGAGYEPPTD